jgi:hypothetical protein
MPRPARFSVDELLDAAAALLAADGPAVTMSVPAPPTRQRLDAYRFRPRRVVWRTVDAHRGAVPRRVSAALATSEDRRPDASRRPVHRAVVPRSPGRGQVR